MNIVFYIIVAFAILLLWCSLSSLFKLIGGAVKHEYETIIDIMTTKDESEEKENE